MRISTLVILSGATASTTFVHPGALHTSDDIARVQAYVDAGDEPWISAFDLLTSNKAAQATYTASPVAVIDRGTGTPENYSRAYRDAAAAYQLALRWLISGDASFADTAVSVLNAWGSTLKDINGTSDMYLAAGLYGYQFANAAELMRSYSGWAETDQAQFGTVLNDVFAYHNLDFLNNHNGNPDIHHYYANWDLCNIASLMAIGIFNDNATLYDFGTQYLLSGPGNGALPVFAIANYTEEGSGKNLTQGQEAGRDQGHSILDIMLLGVIAQQGFNQGDDFFSTYTHEILNAAEYVGKYNVNETVPYTTYESYEGTQSVISDKSRADIRPGFELIVAHYQQVKGLSASWSQAYRDYVNENTANDVEGGGGNYGTTSGGYDSLGMGTLMYRLAE